MFSDSTQKKYWMFKNELELKQHRSKANSDFMERNSHKISSLSSPEKLNYFLSEEEERILIRYYEFQLIDFCKKFFPKLPCDVCGTAFHYMKRFYVHNSVMDFHPKEILITCVYLACKIEEFNISMDQFVKNVKGDTEKATQIILNYELLLMGKLNYYLAIHNIYKPIEGLMVDIKTRSKLKNADKLRPSIENLIDKLYLTDGCLLYAPSQLALAVILHSASKNRENLDEYVTRELLGVQGDDLLRLIETIRKIRTLIAVAETLTMPSKEVRSQIEKKLVRCRCEENNPNSDVFKKIVSELRTEEESSWEWL